MNRKGAVPLRCSGLFGRGRAEPHGAVPLQRLPQDERHRARYMGVLPAKGLRVFGKVSVYESLADSGATKMRSFCPRCGSPLFTQKDTTPERVGIAAGAFDESGWFSPEEIVYPWERPDWDTIDPAIPQQMRPSQ